MPEAVRDLISFDSSKCSDSPDALVIVRGLRVITTHNISRYNNDMKMSKMSVKPEKQAPKDAETINHKLLVQAGFIRQLMAGVYTYLPFGLRVLRKIEKIVREEMDAIGGEEVLMPMLHPAEIWK